MPSIVPVRRNVLYRRGGYVGPGDLGVAFAGWWGFRAYSAAYAASLGKAINIVDGSQANGQDINVTKTGDLDTAAVAAWVALHGAAFVFKLYDQSGNGKDTGTATAQFPYSSSPLGVTNNGSASNMPVASFVVNQPFMIYVYALANADTDMGPVGAATTTDVRLGFRATLNAGIYAGGIDFIATSGGIVATSTFHAIQGIYNGNSSIVDVNNSTGNDGAGGGGLPGTANLVDFQFMRNGSGGFNGNFRECGVIGATSTINAAVNTNAMNYWASH